MRLNAKELIADARITAPTLPPAAAKLMSDMADRLDVQFVALCESREQVKQLAAENAALKEANGIALKILNDEEIMVTSLWASSIQKVEAQTPYTDAFLASLRAEGVEMFKQKLEQETTKCYQDEQIGLDSAVTLATEFAAQLRSQYEQVKGVQS